MNLNLIVGPPAVGKMTVGQALAAKTGYKMLHNHLTLEPVRELFDFGTPSFLKLLHHFRCMLVTEAVNNDIDGLIMTFCWGFEKPSDQIFFDELTEIVTSARGEVFFAELRTDFETRLQRNVTENRLHHKPFKRDLVESERQLRSLEIRTFNTSESYPPPYPDRWLTIDNTDIPPGDVADQIITHFGFRIL
jgi:hypothetical protein